MKAQVAKVANHASMPTPSRTPTSPGPTPPGQSDSRHSPLKVVHKTFDPTPEEGGDGDEPQDASSQMKPTRIRGLAWVRHETMDRGFKFPPSAVPPESDVTSHSQQTPSTGTRGTSHAPANTEEAGLTTQAASIEVQRKA